MAKVVLIPANGMGSYITDTVVSMLSAAKVNIDFDSHNASLFVF